MDFKESDIVYLESLMTLIRDKMSLSNLDCMEVSKAYKSFEWLQGLEDKMNHSRALRDEIEALKRDYEEDMRLKDICIEGLESQLKEAKRKKPASKKKVSKKRK